MVDLPSWLAEFRVGSQLMPRSQQPSAEEAAHIIGYLEDPVQVGLWRLSARWLRNHGVSSDLWRDFETQVGDKETIEIAAGRRNRLIKVTDEWKKEARTQICDRLSFILLLFKFLAERASGQAEAQASSDDGSDEEQKILDVVDTGSIAVKYGDALKVFQDHLFHSAFKPAAVANRITRTKEGAFILSKGPRAGDELVLISWSRQPLDGVATFLDKLGKIQDIELMPIFSPEEELFAPYFDMLALVQERLVKQEHLRPMIKKALSNFSESNYSECVAAIGLAGEDVLTQVFETLFREQLTKGLTLGQLVDEINSRAAALFPKKEDPTPDLAQMFEEMNKAIDSGESAPKLALPIMRKLLAKIIDTNRHLEAKIERIGQPERKTNLFPPKVAHLLTELIRFRNAASHRSRVPIGPYECRRSAFALVVVYRWWERERRAVNWEASPTEIVQELLGRASRA